MDFRRIGVVVVRQGKIPAGNVKKLIKLKRVQAETLLNSV